MRTIKSIAEEFGITKDKARYLVCKLPDFTRVKNAGVTYVTDEGMAILKANQVREEVRENRVNYVREGAEITQCAQCPHLTVLRGQLEIKDAQLAAKDVQLEMRDKQITDITAALLAAQQTVAAAQVLHAGSMKHIGSEENTQKRGFFARIFGKKA